METDQDCDQYWGGEPRAASKDHPVPFCDDSVVLESLSVARATAAGSVAYVALLQHPRGQG